MLGWRGPEGGLAPPGRHGVLGEPLVRHGAVGHQHDGLQASGLPGPGDGEVVSHEAGVDLSVVHGAGVHVLGLSHLHQLHLKSRLVTGYFKKTIT